MNYVHHTRCVDIKDKTYPSWAPSPVTALILLSIPVLLATLVTPYLALIEIPLLIAYCEWWLYDRLICLGGEKCAIGLLGVVEPPEKKTGFDSFDTDYSINLVLAPHNIQELPADYPGSVPPPGPLENKEEYYRKAFRKALHRQIADDGIQGDVIREQAITHDAGWDFEGSFNRVGGAAVVHHHQPYLHCEFEGGGIYKLLEALKILLALATVMAVVCSIPVLGWIACGILVAAAVVLSIAGIVIALNDRGVPIVYDAATGKLIDELRPGRDILFVKGDWIFDTAHEGWNEIHPIKDCQLVATARYETNDVVDWDDAIGSFMVAAKRWRYDPKDPTHHTYFKDSGRPTPKDWKDWVKKVCDGMELAGLTATIQNQARPENQWVVHPVIDGCLPSETSDPRTPPIH